MKLGGYLPDRELYNFQPGDVIELQFVKICKKKEDKDEGINHFYKSLTSKKNNPTRLF